MDNKFPKISTLIDMAEQSGFTEVILGSSFEDIPIEDLIIDIGRYKTNTSLPISVFYPNLSESQLEAVDTLKPSSLLMDIDNILTNL